jgi:ABC-type sugar transport system ATPase subunit
MNTPVFEAHSLRCSQKHAARKDAFSFDLAPGRLLYVAGPPESGKRDLTRVLVGLQAPVSGRILFDGTRCGVIRGCEPPPMATVRQALALQRAASPAFDPEPAQALLEEMGIAGTTRFGALSGCEKYWTLLALAVAARPRLLVLDDPGSVLSKDEVQTVFAVVRCLVAEHEGVAVITGEEMADTSAADDLMILARGRLMLHLPVASLRDEVWEVEYPDGQRYSVNGGSRVLAAKWNNGRRMAWIHCPAGRETIQQTLGENALIRPVGLQQLYWALTGRLAADAAEGTL